MDNNDYHASVSKQYCLLDILKNRDVVAGELPSAASGLCAGRVNMFRHAHRGSAASTDFGKLRAGTIPSFGDDA
jgi:hypothetical protein